MTESGSIYRLLKAIFCLSCNPIVWGIIGTILVCLLGLFVGLSRDCYYGLEGPPIFCESKIETLLKSSPNEIGDTIAGFAGALAFLWIIVTVMIQSKELQAQQMELERQADEFEKMNFHLSAQQFEGAYFEILNSFNQIISQIDINKKSDKSLLYQGRDCFGHFCQLMYNNTKELRLYPDNVTKECVVKKYLDCVYREHRADLAHYFRFLHNSLRFVCESKHRKVHHIRLFRSLLSNDELAIIFYNSQSEHGKEMLPYISEFALFHNLPKTDLLFASKFDLSVGFGAEEENS